MRSLLWRQNIAALKILITERVNKKSIFTANGITLVQKYPLNLLMKEKYAENTDGMDRDILDDNVNVESIVLDPIVVTEFLNTLSEIDWKILTMRIDDVTLEKSQKN